jgi:hypothetical protein
MPCRFRGLSRSPMSRARCTWSNVNRSDSGLCQKGEGSNGAMGTIWFYTTRWARSQRGVVAKPGGIESRSRLHGINNLWGAERVVLLRIVSRTQRVKLASVGHGQLRGARCKMQVIPKGRIDEELRHGGQATHSSDPGPGPFCRDGDGVRSRSGGRPQGSRAECPRFG